DGLTHFHIAFVDTPDGKNPLNESPAFAAFSAAVRDRCDEPPVAMEVDELGSYRFPAKLRICSRMLGSWISLSLASSSTLETASAVLGSSSANGRNSRPRCWAWTGTMHSAPPGMRWTTALPRCTEYCPNCPSTSAWLPCSRTLLSFSMAHVSWISV